MPLTITLKAPIKRGEGELKEVTVRDVTSSDYIALGPIFEMRFEKGVQQMHEDPQKAAQYIVRLAGLTDREVRALSLGDFFKLKGFIQSQLFFPGWLGRVRGEPELTAFRHVAFRVAYFWRMPPSELMSTPLPLLQVLLEEMGDIRDEMRGD